jgi:hypothetical protein
MRKHKFRRNLAQKGLIAIEEQLGTKQYQILELLECENTQI